MKAIYFLLSLTSLLSLSHADENRNWQTRQGWAMRFVAPYSKFATHTGTQLYLQAADKNWDVNKYILNSAASKTDILSRVERCPIPPIFDPNEHGPLWCLRLNQWAQYAPAIYHSWLFVKGMSDAILRIEIEEHFTNKEIPTQISEPFLRDLSDTVEMEVYTQLHGMFHWRELMMNWPMYEREFANWKPVQEHDAYFLATNAGIVARANEASPIKLYKIYQGKKFVEFVSDRFSRQNPKAHSIKQYLKDPALGPAAQILLDHLQIALRHY